MPLPKREPFLFLSYWALGLPGSFKSIFDWATIMGLRTIIRRRKRNSQGALSGSLGTLTLLSVIW